MKFVLCYTAKSGGSLEDRMHAAEKAQKLLASWHPDPSGTISEWVTRVDGNGGFAVLTTDDAKALMKDLGTWSAWLDFQVFPVVDVMEAAPIQEEALAVARTA